MAFWDSSAIVPLCFAQRQTSVLRAMLREHRPLVVWWGTPVEVAGALHRLSGEGAITSLGLEQALGRLEIVRASWLEVTPTEKVRNLAEALLSRYRIRAADAFQLAAALVWCGEKPRNRPFVCFDSRLGEAAREVGFALPVKV